MIPKPEHRAPHPRWPIKRGRRPRWQRKATKAQLMRMCDRVFSVLIRAETACRRCRRFAGRPDMLQTAHVFKRKYLGTRWSMTGAFALCDECHRALGDAPVDGRACPMRAFYEEQRGAELFEMERQDALRITKFDPDTLIRLVGAARVRGILVQVKGDNGGRQATAGLGEANLRGPVRHGS